MNIPGAGRFQSAIRQVGNRLSPPPLILLYHRVTDLFTDPQQLAVSPSNFADQLEMLSEHATLLSMVDLLKWLPSGRWPRRAVVLTFDDGYADNLLEAAPILQKNATPATFFLSSGFIGRDEEFFWDELERVFLQPGWLAPVLQIEIDGRIYRWELKPMEQYTQEDAQRHRQWNVEQAGPTVRHTVYRTLCEFVRKLQPDQQRSAMEQIRDWAGTPKAARPTHRALQRQEVAQLASNAGMEIGAHAVHHPMLALLSPKAQQEEIQRSRAALEALIDRPVPFFAYPYGSRDAFNETTMAAVRDAGFHSACTTLPGAVTRDTNPWQLPRQIVRNWDPSTFATHLRQWFVHG